LVALFIAVALAASIAVPRAADAASQSSPSSSRKYSIWGSGGWASLL